ncbi:hypothetical protein EW145_g2581 [Phellinidium pouzarii]|uniref:PITH domain-containing protein n=1 Tax=Phellinidium pouzarii TaxID=167371 RepID=A0A4S4LAF2_9AGAM|nr:hypothetical protein EW145_g2581 [Phellinidium pouzarii]
MSASTIMSSNDAHKASDISLRNHLDPSQVNCLNEAAEHPLKSILSKDEPAADAYLESDADAQLLINVYFNQTTRVRSMVIHTKEPNLSHAPKSIKLFINKHAIGFEDVEAGEEQTLELSEDDVSQGKPIALHFVKFKSVNSLHLFVESNQGEGEEEATRIDRIDFFGGLNECVSISPPHSLFL